ncbi:divergent polysaccharide deacetylase family protein [Sulfuricurvum sp.]|uniref:divergent polysaccharide deacetylase family protein n=1 Tax=Sulfuricurvum sp. TaxID=2025608 RepID=UPI00262B75D7|nr:divergent polysaccharide deacetylase family protein [Sulfuricurvum sp.]MDD2781917.1 divergent polysaccharide deacetylase family protein [Sulfuricurvum sp.]
MSKRPRPNHIFSLQRLGWGIVGLLLFLIALLIGYVVGFSQAEEELAQERIQTQQLVEQIKDIARIDESYIPTPKPKENTQDIEIRRLKKELQELLDKEQSDSQKILMKREPVKPHHEYAPKDKQALPPPPQKRPIVTDPKGAKLVIIIDDVSYAHDVKAIQSTGLPLVMSFLPPSTRHPESARLAQGKAHFMVHLPLEAIDFNDEESVTLRIDDSEDKIAQRISTLKQLYPNVRYMNNHTGSKFTANADAMEKLIRVMKKEGLIFVDSRTNGQTKVPEVSKKLGLRYYGRDVFLDHHDGVANVKKQIKEAVEKAKRHGTAIAIGHPRADTIKALRESKEILREVELVGIEQI